MQAPLVPVTLRLVWAAMAATASKEPAEPSTWEVAWRRSAAASSSMIRRSAEQEEPEEPAVQAEMAATAATAQGGAIYLAGSVVSVSGSVFVGDSASGGAGGAGGSAEFDTGGNGGSGGAGSGGAIASATGVVQEHGRHFLG